MKMKRTGTRIIVGFLAIVSVLLAAGNGFAEDTADLMLTLRTPRFVDPELQFQIDVLVHNRAESPATEVVVEIDAPALSFTNLPQTCASHGGGVRCDVEEIPPNREFELLLTLAAIAPSHSEVWHPMEGILSSSNRTATARISVRTFPTWYVTNTLDSGAGSLRATIEEANVECRVQSTRDPSCKIAFRIPTGEGQWISIAPRTPLPEIASQIIIDGTTQTRWAGDTNLFGPELVVSGAQLQDRQSDGLVFSNRAVVGAEGLVVNGFGGAGISVIGLNSGGDSGIGFIRACYVGTDATGMEAVPNLRGIVVAKTPFILDIEDNVISGNHRSGIFVFSGVHDIVGNKIGLNRDVSAGLGNGASGIYIGPGARGAAIERNFIGFNHHFGIAVDPEADWISIENNSIQANWQTGIDRGLDTIPTAPTERPRLGDVPVVWGAAWNETAGVTVVEGSLVGELYFTNLRVNLFANDAPDSSGYGEGQYVLGTVVAEPGGHFRAEIPQNLQGKWIAATATLEDCFVFAKPPHTEAFDEPCSSATTEFSKAVFVQ